MSFGIDPFGIPYIPTYEEAKKLEYNALPWKRGDNKGLLPVCTEDGKPKRTYLTIRRDGPTARIADNYVDHRDDIVIRLYSTDILRYQWDIYGGTKILLNYDNHVTPSTHAVINALLRISLFTQDGSPVARVHTRDHSGRLHEQPQWTYLRRQGNNVLYNAENPHRPHPLFILENPSVHQTHSIQRKKMNELKQKYHVNDFLKYYVTPMNKLRDGYAIEEFLSVHPNTKDLSFDNPNKEQINFMDNVISRSDYGCDYVDADIKLLDRIKEARSKEDIDPIEHQLLLLTLAQRCGLMHRSKYTVDGDNNRWYSNHKFEPTQKNSNECMKKYLYDCIKLRHVKEVFVKATYNGDAKADTNAKYINATVPDHPRYTVKYGTFGDYADIIDIT
tara:strand:- start:1802 stop:2968 length:1167 start_codon:yes stop_codon:yes gene_type:complete